MKQQLTQLLFVLTLLCFGHLIVAQDFGIRAGLNYADITGIDEGTSGIIGLQFGPVAEFGLSESAGLNVAALFSMKGNKEDDSNSKSNTNYLDIPVLLHYVFGGFYAEAGPQLSILLSADTDGYSIKEFLKSTDFSAILGIGYDLGSLRVDARYAFGLGNVFNSAFLYNGNSYKNSVITLGVSYMLGGNTSSGE